MLSESLVFSLISSALDIIVVSALIYLFLSLIVNSQKHLTILLGITICIVFYGLASFLELRTTQAILDNVFSWGIIIIVILFQEEIKGYLEKIGSINYFRKNTEVEKIGFLEEFADTVYSLASTKTGALVTFKGQVSLDKYTNTAIELNSDFSKYLMISIFNKESPLHDGAVIIESEKIRFASAYYPIALDISLGKEYGTRHRAALTLSKETDSISVIVSEETGIVSVAHNNKLFTDMKKDFFIHFMNERLKQEK